MCDQKQQHGVGWDCGRSTQSSRPCTRRWLSSVCFNSTIPALWPHLVKVLASAQRQSFAVADVG